MFAALGLGLALPFVLVAFVPALRRLLPRPGPWMVRLQRFLAIPMAATAVGCLWLLWRQGGATALGDRAGRGRRRDRCVLVWLGRRQRRGAARRGRGAGRRAGGHRGGGAGRPGAPRPAPRASRSGAAAWSEAAVARELAAGRPVFAYFTADWCLTCKVNEAAAIERDEVRDAFRKAGVKVVVGDWTNGDPAITRFLDARARAGVPLYLWYEPGAGRTRGTAPDPDPGDAQRPRSPRPPLTAARCHTLRPATQVSSTCVASEVGRGDGC